MPTELIVVLIVAIVVIVGFTAYWHEKQQIQAATALAQSLGFEFLGQGRHHLPAPVWSLKLFNQGRDRRVQYVMTGTVDDATVYLCRYSYRTGGHKNSSTHAYMVAIFVEAALALPQFSLTPLNLLHRIGKVFGYQDITFADYPQFSQQYLLQGHDEAAIRALFNYAIIPLFEQHQGLSCEANGSCLLFFYRWSRSVALEQWPNRLDNLTAIYRQLKRFA